MNKIWILAKIQLLTFFGYNKALYTHDPKERRRALLLRNVMLLVIIYLGFMSFAYSNSLSEYFLSSNNMDALLALMFVASGTAVLASTIVRVNGMLFSFRDYDVTMSLPVTAGQVVASRLLVLYIMDLGFSLMLMIPAGAVYVMRVVPPWSFYLYFPLSLLFLPLIPMALATVIGALVTAVTARMRRKSMAHLILMVIIMLGAFSLSFSMNSDMGKIASAVAGLSSTFQRLYPPTALFIKGVCQGQLLDFLLFAVISSLCFALLTFVLGRYFTSINTALASHKTQRNFHLTRQTKSSVRTALYRKEIRRYFSSANYVLNTSIGLLLLTALSVALLFFHADQLAMLLGTPGIADYIQNYAPILVTVFIALSCTTSSSISLEGKNLWIVQSAPIAARTLFTSKIMVNLSLSIPAVLLNSTLLLIALKPGIMTGVLLYLLPLTYCFFIAVMGLFINLKMPMLDWNNEIAVIKQSGSSIVSMLVGFGSFALPILLSRIPFLSGSPALWLSILIIAAITATIALILHKHGDDILIAL